MNDKHTEKRPEDDHAEAGTKPPAQPAESPKEYGGRKDGLDPTRYGDWEKNGRCIDF